MLSINEIKSRAAKFAVEWQSESRENAEAKSFWDGFFEVFGISRRRVACFEEPVKKLNNKNGFIDLFWKGTLLVEHKSRGKDLTKAYTQAIDYFPNLKDEDLPRYILVSDFARFKLYDLDNSSENEFELTELSENISLFDFMTGRDRKKNISQDPVNIKAAELMGQLHDRLAKNGYVGYQLEIFLVRILFCLFADDTGIFEPSGLFYNFLLSKTNEDGSDVGSKLTELFQLLDTPINQRYKNTDEELSKFPYINGSLFSEIIRIPAFDSELRNFILEASKFDWGKISPAIFGSLFQSVMDPKARRNLGAHYTSEKNILRLIKPLFLDELWDEFYIICEAKQRRNEKLEEFQNKLATLKFLDPACGCGNFLIITYRELRKLEIAILKELNQTNRILDISLMAKVDVDQMVGIEIEEWPAKVAEVALWLMDHQMNLELSKEFGQYFARLPLKKSAKIINKNALEVNWETIVPKSELSYILGNPPFIGKQWQTKEQKVLMNKVFNNIKGSGVLDFVTAWYILAAKYIQGTRIKVAFVSTNSICQGEQVGILWQELFYNYRIKIHFAHQTFSWSNEAKNNAAVHVVIIGFANYEKSEKIIFEYDDLNGEPFKTIVDNINPYLVSGKDIFVSKRRTPICKVKEMVFGSMPNDGGFLILSNEEYESLIYLEPDAKRLIKPFLGASELINNKQRWCLWLAETNPQEIRSFPEIIKRLDLVRKSRLSSSRATTRQLAETPGLFGEIRQPQIDYLAIPEVSSERRNYIPIAFLSKDIICSNKIYTISGAGKFEFGMISSRMHIIWIKYVSGRLKSDFQYSTGIVYNNFPWPINIDNKQMHTIEQKAQNILDTRAKYPNSSLADLYDPLTMPSDLVKAHAELDKAIEKAYRKEPFKDDNERIEFLFNLYEQYINDKHT